MEKIIIVKYIERNMHEYETWTRFKCIPYTMENHERIIKYLKVLNNSTGEDFMAYHKVITDTFFPAFNCLDQTKKELCFGIFLSNNEYNFSKKNFISLISSSN